MKLLWSAENQRQKWCKCATFWNYRKSKVLFHCNIVNNGYQQNSGVLYTFVLNKPFGSLLEVSPKIHIF